MNHQSIKKHQMNISEAAVGQIRELILCQQSWKCVCSNKL